MVYVILAALVWAVYNVVVAVRHGVQSSLSATYYTPTGKQWLVPMIGSVVVLLSLVCFDAVEEQWDFLVFLSFLGLAFVGATPKSRSQEQGKVHTVAAVVSGVSSQALVAVLSPWSLLLWVAFPVLWRYAPKAKLFWAEMIVFASSLLMITNVIN